ncbi:MAG: hypothetical protein NZT92_03080 [Abditibacteriales bacterium]|nr:hypothetical protein [Abditibacteriales bacterium]
MPRTFGAIPDGAKYVQVEVGGSDPTNPAQPGWYCAHLYRNGGAVRAFTVGATFVQIGRANKVPWAGWWWPMEDAMNPNLYDAGGPYDKYDQYVWVTTSTNPGVRSAEARPLNNGGHRVYTASGSDDWYGHCHAWAAAAIVESEPRLPLTKAGITFWVGDLKGLLTGLHYGSPEAEWLRSAL